MKTERPTLNTSKINELRDFLQIRQGKKCKDYFSRYPLGEEWVYSGKLFSEKIIYSDSGPAEMIRASHRANAFNLPNTRNDKRKELELQWWKEFFKREFKIDIETLHQDYQESEEIPEEEQIIYHGKRFSYNFFLKLAYLQDIAQNTGLSQQECLTIMELGGGDGTLARLMKTYYPTSRYIIVDLPESLFFSHLNLHLNFPNCGFKNVSTIEEFYDSVNDKQIDFIFVPSFLTEGMETQLPVDLFVNTESMGEMRNECIEYWFDFIQNKISVQNLYMANRFFNQFSPLSQGWRVHQNKCSVLFDKNWHFTKWELEPEYKQCPYQGGVGPKTLRVIAQRVESSDEILDDTFIYEDWYRQYYLVPGDEPPFLSSANNPLHLDLTRKGTLFKIWNSVRLNPNEKNLDAMIKLMSLLERKFPYEEKYYYFDLYKKVTGKPHFLNRRWDFQRTLRTCLIFLAYKLPVKKILRALNKNLLIGKLSGLVWDRYTDSV